MPRASTSQASPATRGRRRAPFTLGVDIGGTNIKTSVLDRDGTLTAERRRVPTPKPATPAAVLEAIAKLAAKLPRFDRISIGFPGVVRGGTVTTAPNLGSEHWSGYRLIDALAHKFGTPVRVLNDAAVHGLGVVQGRSLACVITLGTGIGCALFRNRRLLLHLELGQHGRFDQTYDQYIGQKALEAIGSEAWNPRVREAVNTIMQLTSCEELYIGGGNARRITFPLPPQVTIVSNAAGVTGGVRLWEAELDEMFEDEPNAQWPALAERSQ
jgi:polyphosphate glucokinase